MKNEQLDQLKKELFNPEVKLTNKLATKKELFLLKIPLFSLIYQKKGQQNFRVILENVKLIKTEFGGVVFHNQEDRTFNYILKGSVMLFVTNKDEETKNNPKFFKKISQGEYFGEKMDFGKDQLQSVRSVSPSYLLQLDMPSFYHAFSGHFQYNELRDKINFLKMIWVFSKVRRPILERVLLSSEMKKYWHNNILFRVGDTPQFILIVFSGEITLFTVGEEETIKYKPFCILGKAEVCGIDEIIQDTHFTYSGVVTSQCVEILKVQRKLFLEAIGKQLDIEKQTILKRSNITKQLIDSKIEYKRSFKMLEDIHKKSIHRRVKTEADQAKEKHYEPLDKIEILNKLFVKEVQLKEEKIRNFKLQDIDQFKKVAERKLSNLSNNLITFDKNILLKYLTRKQRKIQYYLQKQRGFQSKKILLVQELSVQRSAAVKNQKRKLKNSRRVCLSEASILT